jgi:hypothetical protein
VPVAFKEERDLEKAKQRYFHKALTVFVFLNIWLWAPGFLLAEELPVFYRGVRPLGMGGAFTAVADDENAIFYNQANIGQSF